MEDDRPRAPEEELHDFQARQCHQLEKADSRCRALQLPDGLLLRYTLARTLFFYLRTGLRDGKLATRIYASDSPYERQKADIGEVLTPMFEDGADRNHLVKVQQMLRSWIHFVRESVDGDEDFKSFEIDVQPR